MFLSGYHGTSLEAAQSIMESKEFNISNGDKEWLGDGIYFYYGINDAVDWRDTEAIIHTIIKVDPDNFLDLETDEGKRMVSKVKNLIVKKYSMKISKNIQENQCAVMRTIWAAKTDLLVMAGAFPKEEFVIKTLTDERELRREFCVRNNTPIKYIHCIKKERFI